MPWPIPIRTFHRQGIFSIPSMPVSQPASKPIHSACSLRSRCFPSIQIHVHAISKQPSQRRLGRTKPFIVAHLSFPPRDPSPFATGAVVSCILAGVSWRIFGLSVATMATSKTTAIGTCKVGAWRRVEEEEESRKAQSEIGREAKRRDGPRDGVKADET